MKVSILALTLVSILPGATSTPPPTAYSIETVAGSSQVGDGGRATAAALSDAEGVATDAAGNVFISDANDHRVRKIAADGTISTIAGVGFPGFSGDGGPASAARLNTPYGVAVDGAGNVFIADLGNNRVRQVSPDGTITTVPGTENLLAPRNVALHAAGTLYISEFGGHRVRRLRSDGVLESIAGNGIPGFAGDGGAARTAQLAYPAGIAFDTAGNLYVADSSNHRVRKIVNGLITTVLGTGDPGADFPNQLNLPTSIAIDSTGNLYVADSAISGSSWSRPLARLARFQARVATWRSTGRAICLSRAVCICWS
jgi:sugar lactone lactonase YvrE